jgi:hypothetical protein
VAAASEQAREMAAKAKKTAMVLARKAKQGAWALPMGWWRPAAIPRPHDALPERQSDRAAPSEGVSVARPDAATLVIADSQGKGLVVNAAADRAYVAEAIGNVTRLSIPADPRRPRYCRV